MCTVTFIPQGDTAFITHNRDEKSSRAKAIAPKEYIINGYALLFPRDGEAGGTWMAVNENGAAAVLLNGGFIKHLQQPKYRKSRGLVFLEIIAAADVLTSYHNIDLTGIEPFTVILWNNAVLHECRWDGQQKHISRPDATMPHTWSSATLYDEAIRAKRKSWFNKWLRQHPTPVMEDIIQFHLCAGDGDAHNDLRMNRHGELLTVSITSLEINNHTSLMQYADLQQNTRTVHAFNFTKAAATQ